MGCNASKLDDQEAVQICKDRKKFIKQALEHRTKFASGHIAYVQSLKRVSAALREYIGGDELREFLLDSFITPVKKLNPKFIAVSPKCFSATAIQCEENPNMRVNYYRPSGTESVSVEEKPQSPDTYRVHSYSPMHQYGGFDGFFTMQSPQRNSSYYSQSHSSYNRHEIPPPYPKIPSQWDLFWDPFSSLDYYGYPVRNSLEGSMVDDIAGLRQVREEQGILNLEKETEHEEIDERRHRKEEKPKVDSHVVREVTVDVDETEDVNKNQHQASCLQEHANDNMMPSQVPKAGQVEVNSHETIISEREKKEEAASGFTVYVNKRPTSMDEAIKDLESQFMIVCGAANEVAPILEANRAHCLPASSEVTGT